MIGSGLRIAWRNLGRNVRRTALTLGAIAIAQCAVLQMDGLMNGIVDSTLESVTGPLMGHVQIHEPSWREERAPDLVIEDVDATLAAVRGTEGVEAAYARIYAPALIAREVDGHAAMIVGIDVERESQPGGLLDGLPLEAHPGERRALVGRALAREAGIEVGDELAVLGTGADGSMANDLVVVGGILRTPVDLINRTGVIIPLETAQEIFTMPDQAHEITVRGTGTPSDAPALAARLGAVDALGGLEILPWSELSPEIAQMFQITGFYGLIVLFIVFIAAAAGVANTMMMATFERRRELGMLLSLGTAPRRLVGIVLTEAVILGLFGVLLGTLVGGALVAYQGHVGIDPTNLGGGAEEGVEIAVYGISFSNAIHPYLRVLDVIPGVIGVLVVSVLAALGPAGQIARLEPVAAMRGTTDGAVGKAAGFGGLLRSVASRYAVRSLSRNVRRTILSVLGVGFGVGVGLLSISMVQGLQRMTIEAAATGGIGHLRVAPAGWVDSRDAALRLEGGAAPLEAIRAIDGVDVATPRARMGGLLGLGTRSAFVQLTGVDPATEQRALRTVRIVTEGRYLTADDEGALVLGAAPARRLGAELGDELVVTAVDDEGEMQSRLLLLVGVVATGSSAVDETIAHVSLADVEALSGREGPGEITIRLDDPDRLDEVQAAVRGLVEGSDEVLSWAVVSPELSQNMRSKSSFYDMAVFVILLVVLLGVASAQLTGVLERRKEFAVLAALGMRGRTLVRVVLSEGLLLGCASALGALLWASPITYYISSTGIDLTSALQSGEGISLGGVLFDPVLKGGFGLWLLPTALGLALLATITASLYPAWFATKTDPAAALRVDR
ncbi:MAG: ABC transporter permease [Sandaracinaceae bacterium]|nr:ABC transporter permease [Sandaracinaceae bacterium]